MKGIIHALSGLLLLAVPAVVQAQYAYSTNADGSIYTYSTNTDGSANIAAYSGPPWVVTIPTNINGLTVTDIGTDAFYDATNLASVTIPGGVTSMGDGVFLECAYLTNATISNGVTTIGNYAFYGCASLASVTIPESVTSIGMDAFYDCASLASVYFVGYGPYIDSSVFYGDPVTFYYLFGTGDGYDYITNAGNTNTITIIGYTGPGGAVTIPTNINNLLVTGIGDGMDSVFANTGVTSVTIPGSITSIGEGAFGNCSSLTNATISYGVTSIGVAAFIGSGLVSVTIPGSVTSIGDYAFESCFSLASVTIADGVTNIGKEAFVNCVSLASITIPASVTSIEDGAFQTCFSLASLYFTGNAPSADSTVFSEDPTVYYLPGTTGWDDFSANTGVATMPWNPVIQTADGSFGVQNNQFGFNITWASGLAIVVEACTNLTSPVWTPLTNVTLTNGSFYFSDPQWANYPTRFYGLVLP